jgi:hypothetical protein
MGIFSKKESLSAQDVRKTMQPFIEMVKDIEMKASAIDEMSKDWISKTEEVMGLIYSYKSKSIAESQRLIQLLMKGAITPEANSAAAKSFDFLSDQIDERISMITQSLIDSGMSFELGIEFHINSWKRASKISPKEIANFGKLMAGGTQWDWINETSWT